MTGDGHALAEPDANDPVTVWADLDPAVERIVRVLHPLDLTDPEVARREGAALMRALWQGGDEAGPNDALLVDAGGVPAALYHPSDPASAQGVLVYAHGGGFVTGSTANSHRICLHLADLANCHVVSVDYPLAPEHPFPAALEACWRTLCWVTEGGLGPSVDARRVAVGGASAGGTLAAATALMARDRFGPGLALQLLDEPALDCRMNTPSAVAARTTPIIDRGSLETMWRHYLGDRQGSSWSNEYASPALRADLGGLAAAHIVVAQNDPLRDEALEYGSRLARAGVPVSIRLYAGTTHGFTQMAGVELATEALVDQARALRRAFTQ
jgi:acetyl esterase